MQGMTNETIKRFPLKSPTQQAGDEIIHRQDRFNPTAKPGFSELP
jgi:hypothetical protein